MSLRRRAISLAPAAFLFTAAPALAADNFVKPAPTAAPSAGPTVASATAFCGEPTAKADDLIQRYSSNSAMKQVHKSVDYVAYADDEKNPTVMYTFTVSGHPAHPAAVCRKVFKEGESAVIRMFVQCDGAAKACDSLRNDFNVLLARMQADVEQRIAADKK